MNREELLEFVRTNPVFHLATVENDQPRVRGMLVYSADDNGIVFHTGSMRDVYRQIEVNPKVEMCFNDLGRGIQVRVSGELEQVEDVNFKDEVADHPGRAFLKPWRGSLSREEFHRQFIVYRLRRGEAVVWTMDRNLAPKEPVRL